MNNCIYVKPKESGLDYLIDVMIEKNMIPIDSEAIKEKTPELIVFLIIIDTTNPDIPPKILTKSNFCSPSLMDGRDLLKEISPRWSNKTTIRQLIEGMLPFVGKVVNARGYKFYGTFHLGATYNLKNFENMIVVTFDSTVEVNDDPKKFIKSLNKGENYELILTEDSFLLFETLKTGNGKLAFWSSLFAINDLKINKLSKMVSINFYDEESNNDFQIKLKIDNILLFRDILVKKMKSLKVKVESQKLLKGQQGVKRLTAKEIKEMKINEIEKNVKDLNDRITKGEINDYTVNTFTTLCGKAIEHYSMLGNEKFMDYMNMMKTVLNMEGVNKFTAESGKESE